MAAHYDADRYEEFLEHSALAVGGLSVGWINLLPNMFNIASMSSSRMSLHKCAFLCLAQSIVRLQAQTLRSHNTGSNSWNRCATQVRVPLNFEGVCRRNSVWGLCRYAGTAGSAGSRALRNTASCRHTRAARAGTCRRRSCSRTSRMLQAREHYNCNLILTTGR